MCFNTTESVRTKYKSVIIYWSLKKSPFSSTKAFIPNTVIQFMLIYAYFQTQKKKSQPPRQFTLLHNHTETPIIINIGVAKRK